MFTVKHCCEAIWSEESLTYRQSRSAAETIDSQLSGEVGQVRNVRSVAPTWPHVPTITRAAH